MKNLIIKSTFALMLFTFLGLNSFAQDNAKTEKLKAQSEKTVEKADKKFKGKNLKVVKAKREKRVPQAQAGNNRVQRPRKAVGYQGRAIDARKKGSVKAKGHQKHGHKGKHKHNKLGNEGHDHPHVNKKARKTAKIKKAKKANHKVKR